MSKLQAAFSQAFGATLHLIGEGLATPERAEVVKSATNRCHPMTHGRVYHGSQDPISAVLQVNTSPRLAAALHILNLTNFSFMIEPIRELPSIRRGQTYEAEKSSCQAYFRKNMNKYAIFAFIMMKLGTLTTAHRCV
ncbi:hypothetical protein [Marivita lacus]|uniref:hypothetical protein n=1 Tax=Marivita lacus TaxID=1323742 RepID=UPI00166EB516|nr:hypothetical protein [Marivita lacus]